MTSAFCSSRGLSRMVRSDMRTQRIVDFIIMHPVDITVRDIVQETGVEYNHIRSVMRRFQIMGVLDLARKDPVPKSGNRLNVYRLNHSTAVRLADILDACKGVCAT